MKRTIVLAAVCFLLLAACRSKDQEKVTAHPIPAAVQHATRLESAQKPYYYGLIEEYRTILEEDPRNLAAIIGLGNAYSESAAWREAIQQYERALEIDPRNADVRSDMGTAYRNIGMPDRALAEYRQALVQEPGHLNARYHMGIVYAFDRKNYSVAIHVWDELLRIAPTHPQADYMRTCIATFRKALKKEHP